MLYIDEIDKIGKTTERLHHPRRPGEGVQQSLLKMLEGTVANAAARGTQTPRAAVHPDGHPNILFICGGTFVGLERSSPAVLVARRWASASTDDTTDERIRQLLPQVTADDIMHFGLIPEVVGRLPVVAPLAPLNKEALVRVLQEPKNALIKQYQKLFSLENSELEFTEGALLKIAEMAMERETGARGLRSIVEDMMLDLMYYLPERGFGQRYRISEETVTSKGKVLPMPEPINKSA